MNYSYRALDHDGKMATGEMDAPDKRHVLRDLEKQGLLPVDVTEVNLGLFALLNKPIEFGSKLPHKELLGFTRELATLIDAGLTLSKSLSVLGDMTRNKKSKTIIAGLLRDIHEGDSLTKALKKDEGLFPKFYISMVGASEASGQLATVLLKLSDYLERSHEVREKIKSALLYPMVLLIMVVFAMALIITVVLPQFEPIFDQVDVELPLLTRMVMGLSHMVNENGGLILTLCGLATVGSVYAYKMEKVKKYFHRKILSFPILGDMIKKSEFARFHRMLGTLLQNGLSLVPSFSISIEGISNIYIRTGVHQIFDRLKEGANMSDQYLKADFVPTLAVELTRVGEDTGRLGEMLIRTADIMDAEVKGLVDKFMALLVPLLTIFMGVIIAGMIASVLLGIMSVNEIAF